MDFLKGTPCQFFFGLQLFSHFFGAQSPIKGEEIDFSGGIHAIFLGGCSYFRYFRCENRPKMVKIDKGRKSRKSVKNGENRKKNGDNRQSA